jgi:predicted nucleotidyltransferase
VTLPAELQRIRDTLPQTLVGTALHRAIASVLRRHVPARTRCFLFGSEATGKTWRSSDIDIGLLSDAPIPASILLRIQDDLELLPSLRVFDLVDFHDVSTEFRENALRDAIFLDESS